MKSLLFFIALTLILPFKLMAQVNGTTISGKIIDQDQKATPFVTVTLFRQKDSAIVKVNLTNDEGVYQFENITDGNYYISAFMLSMGKVFSNPFLVSGTKKNLKIPDLLLQPSFTELKTVEVNATKPLITHEPGKTVVNVENSILSSGNTVLDVLEKSPNVFVDKDGNISLNGKSGVNVMLNGKPTHLSSKQLNNVLKSMSAENVSRIELMTQPSAKYDAEGSAGLINIITKKNNIVGLNGSLNAGFGMNNAPAYTAGGALNYKNKKISIYANYQFNHKKDEFEMGLNRKFHNPDGSIQTILNQNSELNFLSDNHTGLLGLDYTISPRQSIGFLLNESVNNGDFTSLSLVYFLNAASQTDSVSTTSIQTGMKWNNFNANLHYDLNIDSTGQQLSVNFDYGKYHQSSPQTLLTTVKDPEGKQIHDSEWRRGSQPNTVNIYAAKLDYSLPLKGNAKIEAGLKFSLINTDNNSQFETLTNGDWQVDTGNTNHFIYKENVNAAYVNFNKSFQKGWQLQLGLRGEQTVSNAEQRTSDSTTKRNYFQLFPNLALTKVINPNNMLSLSYARRIDRPSYQNLNPFIYYVDKYTYRTGNPYLQPQLTRSLELAYTLKRKYSFVLGYSHTRDIMAEVIKQDQNTHITYQTQDNLNNLSTISLNIGAPVTVTKWWNMYNSLHIANNHFKGQYGDYDLNKSMTSFTLSTHQSFSLTHNWKAELSGFYRSGFLIGPVAIKPIGSLSAGIQKDFWNHKASLKFNVRDIFQSMNYKGTVYFGNLDIISNASLHRRYASISFTWHFGNQKIKVKQHTDSGMKAEQNRIKKQQQ